MTERLTWRTAIPEDVPELRDFVCTRPQDELTVADSGPLHPRIWEWHVQATFRQLGKPAEDGEESPFEPDVDTLLIGEDDEGIAAVAWYTEQEGPSVVKLLCLGVASRCRTNSGSHGKEALAKALDAIEQKALSTGQTFLYVHGLVHPNNRASQRMCREVGLSHSGDSANDDQIWSYSPMLDQQWP